MKVMKRSNAKLSPVASAYLTSLLPSQGSPKQRGMDEYIPDATQAVNLPTELKVTKGPVATHRQPPTTMVLILTTKAPPWIVPAFNRPGCHKHDALVVRLYRHVFSVKQQGT